MEFEERTIRLLLHWIRNRTQRSYFTQYKSRSRYSSIIEERRRTFPTLRPTQNFFCCTSYMIHYMEREGRRWDWDWTLCQKPIPKFRLSSSLKKIWGNSSTTLKKFIPIWEWAFFLNFFFWKNSWDEWVLNEFIFFFCKALLHSYSLIGGNVMNWI